MSGGLRNASVWHEQQMLAAALLAMEKTRFVMTKHAEELTQRAEETRERMERIVAEARVRGIKLSMPTTSDSGVSAVHMVDVTNDKEDGDG